MNTDGSSSNNDSERQSVSESQENARHESIEGSTDVDDFKIESRKLKTTEGQHTVGVGNETEVSANDGKLPPRDEAKGKSKRR